MFLKAQSQGLRHFLMDILKPVLQGEMAHMEWQAKAILTPSLTLAQSSSNLSSTFYDKRYIVDQN